MIFTITTACGDHDTVTGSDSDNHDSSCTEGTVNCACHDKGSCDLGLSCVDGKCIDPSGHKEEEDEANDQCLDDECRCPGGGLACGGGCVDEMSDWANCGGCGNICGHGEECVQGECLCEDGGSVCDGACRLPSFFESDDENCGSCGTMCTGDMICSGGACICPPGSEFCDGACQPPGFFENNDENCGTCGNVCAISCAATECINAPQIQITAGKYHTCALLEDETVRCWGYNAYGQLGDGSTTDSTTPVPVSGLSGAAQIAAGTNHTCALLEDGTARCWGQNNNGQLGDGSTVHRTTPVAVIGLSGATQVAAGINHTCAVLEDGTVLCWGGNHNGQLGDGTKINRYSPTPVVW